MTVEVINDEVFNYAPNPKLEGGSWDKEFPTISGHTLWLRHKITGEFFPNNGDFNRFSDSLEPTLESPTWGGSDSLFAGDYDGGLSDLKTEEKKPAKKRAKKSTTKNVAVETPAGEGQVESESPNILSL